MSKEIQWRIEKYKPGDEEKIIELVQKDIKLRGSQFIFNIDFWNWKFNSNNEGFYPNWIFLAISKTEAKVVGHYTVIPVRMVINGKQVLCTQSVDTLVDKDYRFQGIFTGLAKECYKEVKNDNFDIVYGYPNERSYPGLVSKLNWIDICLIEELAYVLNPKKIAKVKLSNPLTRLFGRVYLSLKMKLNERSHSKYRKFYFNSRTSIDFNFDLKIINKWLDKKYKIYVDRNLEYLTWRYLKNPIDKNIIIKQILDKNAIVGCYVLKIKKYPHRGNLIICHIMELLSDPDDIDVINFILFDIVNYCKKNNVDILHIYAHKEQHDYHLLKRFGFINFDKKQFVIRINKNVDKYPGINKERNWYISLGDSDRA